MNIVKRIDSVKVLLSEYVKSDVKENIVIGKEEYFHIQDNFFINADWNKSELISSYVYITEEYVNVITNKIICNEKITNLFIDAINNMHFHKKDIQYKTYIMYDEISKLYKIGKSGNVKFREKTLSGQIPKIKTLFYLDLDIEMVLHKQYSKNRIRGEWFDLGSKDILTIVKKHGFVKYDYSLPILR